MSADLPDLTDDCLEAIAKEIEALRAKTIWQIAKWLAEAREIFRYRRDEGGFAGWVETRLRFTRQTAYNLLHVHEQFGEESEESVKRLDTFSASVLYLLSAPSTPTSARTEVTERAKAGETLLTAEVKRVVKRHRDTERGKHPTKQKPARKSQKPPPPAPTPARDDIGAESNLENARLSARVEELQKQKHQLGIKTEALESEVEELKASKSSNTTTRGPRPPPPNETLLRLSSLLAGRGESGERFVRAALLAYAKQIIEAGTGDIETARKVLEKFGQRDAAR